ncbi:MAG TPA: DegT/DnrJ/EryC1/StrS aminotransferase family protein [Pyrinomonadaceae bacterium]|nr:DegT/DnrJ/EryC1/StrS aminotransferase family protein [Pyrinomonadaceae bacterium]
MILRIPPAKVYFPAEDRRAILQHLDEALVTGQLTLGKHVKAFEEQFGQQTNTRYAIAVNSGTSSLEIPLRIFGVRDKTVLLPTNTFFATPAAIMHAGGRPRFVDADPATFSVTLDGIKGRLTHDTAGVIVVHIAGIVTPEMPAIREFCKERKLFLIEDAAHAQGCLLNGQPAGTFGDAASFSFYPTKVMTSAEGGMLVTNRQDVYEEALIYRDQGKADFYSNFHTRPGYNWRMSEPHAIIGASQLNRLEEFVAARNRVAHVYDEGLKEISGIHALPLPEGCYSNYYKYLALLDPGIDRKALKQLLREKYGVGLSGEVYDTPCHVQPVFEEFREGEFPIAADICSRHVCLPVYATMTEGDARYVLSSMAQAINHFSKGQLL